MCIQGQLDEQQKRLMELQAEEARPKLTPEEQRAQLRGQIKADNAAVEVATVHAKETAEAVRKLEARLTALEEPEKYVHGY